jgi:amino acid adenylation domain-containing protein
MLKAELDVHAGRDAAKPLSSPQERLFLLDQMMPGLAAYNVPTLVRVQRNLDAELVRQGLELIVARHEVLRTRIELSDGVPVQEVMAPSRFELQESDLRALAPAQRDREAERWIGEFVSRPFDLAGDVLLRAALIHTAADTDLLLTVFHHIASDHASAAILLNELDEAYRALQSAASPELPQLAIQYGDYAERQRARMSGPELSELLAYWTQQLAGAPRTLELPADRARPSVQSYRGRVLEFELPVALGEALRRQSRAHGVSLFVTLQAAFDTLIARYTGVHDIVLGVPVSGRHDEDTQTLLGCFTNTVPVRSDLSGDPTFAELLARVKLTTLEAQIHQELPFEKLVEALNPPRDQSHSPVFQIFFGFDVAPGSEPTLGGAAVQTLSVPGWEWARFDLSLVMREQRDGSLRGHLEYACDLFDRPRIERLIGHYTTLLQAVALDTEVALSRLPILGADERQTLVVDWNRTAREYERRCLHELISAQVDRTPDAVAVVSADGRCTYRELERRANQLAHELVSRGVAPGARVGICVERGIEMMVAILGVLKSGAAYVPIDPSYPPERQELMLADCGARVLLTQERLHGMLDAGEASAICLDRDWPSIARHADAPPDMALDVEQLAYVIYTSGSTGRPKGVEVTHRALVNFLAAMRERPGLTASDVLLAVTTLSFDIAGLELYLPLLVGARVVIAPLEVTMDGVDLADWLARHGVTFMQATPTTWQLLVDAGWTGSSGLTVACGGEALAPSLARELLDRCAALWHMYGPTETTIWSSTLQLTREHPAPVLGGPIANTLFYVLDAQREPVPIGVPGELYIAGDGVAAGYHDQEQLTGARFVSDPFCTGGGRMYRTGDLVRWRQDGTLDFIGRMDEQVKLRGFRIELGEIEALLVAQDGVAGAVASIREDVLGDRRLVAYVLADAGATPELDRLRAALKVKLPPYMMPSAFVLVERFPTTPNGKLDRRSLPAPDGSRSGMQPGYAPPETPMEETVATIWSDVLGVARIGREDDFFDLGGHSLLAVKMLARLQDELGVQIPLRTLFASTTVSELALEATEAMLGHADEDELASLLAELEGQGS